MTIYFNNSGGASINLSNMTRVKRVRQWHQPSSSWIEIEELWHNDTGSPSSNEANYKLIHRTIVVDITTNQENYNLFNELGSPTDPVTVLCNIASGVTIGATTTGNHAFDTGTGWHADAKLEVVNAGTILGKGGVGGAGASVTCGGSTTYVAGNNGNVGGPAINMQHTLSLVNTGIIGGGGGGGGGGIGWHNATVGGSGVSGGGGGSGGGYGSAAGGDAGTVTSCGGGSGSLVADAGQANSDNSGGSGGNTELYASIQAVGGAGGSVGVAGSAGGGNIISYGSAGGGAGGLGAAGGDGGPAYGGSASPGSGAAAGRAVTLTSGTLYLDNSGSVYGDYT